MSRSPWAREACVAPIPSPTDFPVPTVETPHHFSDGSNVQSSAAAVVARYRTLHTTQALASMNTSVGGRRLRFLGSLTLRPRPLLPKVCPTSLCDCRLPGTDAGWARLSRGPAAEPPGRQVGWQGRTGERPAGQDGEAKRWNGRRGRTASSSVGQGAE